MKRFMIGAVVFVAADVAFLFAVFKVFGPWWGGP